MARKRPMTTEKLFDIICKILKEKGRLPDMPLGTDDEAMHIMAALLADFIIEEYRYVNVNLDDFVWEGVNVYVIEESGEKIFPA